MACCSAEIHVGDIGTVYRVRALDCRCVDGANSDSDFDISEASVLELIFKMPNDVVLRKSATLATNGSPATQWFLEYEVQPGDGLGSPGEFHDNEGAFQVQGFVQFPDGKQWHSKVQTVDACGQELRIHPNLD